MSEFVLQSSDQIIFSTDRDGFVREASPAFNQLGYQLLDLLIGPNILDLADRSCRPALREGLEVALAGHGPTEWIEFRSAAPGASGRWLAIRFAPLMDELRRIDGTLGILRNVAETTQLEERLFRAELTDPLTGLTNRQAWLQMLDHLIASDGPSAMALVDIDFFKAINLHYGMATGDRFLVEFAEFLRSVVPAGVSISRVGASRFGLIFAGWHLDSAKATCREIVTLFKSLGCADGQGRFPITASAGLSPVDRDLDQTVKAAEAALRHARAKGGNTVSGS